jgi:hypothetical protein
VEEKVYLYGTHRFKQRKVLIFDELADIKLYELSVRSLQFRPEAARTFGCIHEVLGNIRSNDTFAMDLWCRWGLIRMSHECSGSLGVIIDIKSRCPCREALAREDRSRFTRSYFLQGTLRHLNTLPFQPRDMMSGMLLS